jgi:hypothetical protein
MGSYNQHQKKLPNDLQSPICPFCNSIIKPIDRNPGDDSFEFRCDSCNENIIIAISGSIFPNYENYFNVNNKSKLKYIQEQIKKSSADYYIDKKSFN